MARTTGGLSLSTEILSVHDLPPLRTDDRWHVPSAALTPSALLNERDARWRTTIVTASEGGQVVGLLPLHQAKTRDFPGAIFDPVRVAPAIFGTTSRAADSYLLIGRTSELVSGAVVAAGLDETHVAAVITAMADRAFADAARRGLRGTVLYLRDDQLAHFVRGDPARIGHRIDDLATMAVVRRWPDDYLSSLDHGRRSVVKRDWRRFATSLLSATESPAADLTSEAASLVAQVKRRHGVLDHPRLVGVRLSGWAKGLRGRRLAFAVRDRRETLLAVSFGCHYSDVLEMYEIGLADDPEHRHLAYAEALVYAPMRYASRNGCRSIHLGLGSPRPKSLRGATFSPVWAIGIRKEWADRA